MRRLAGIILFILSAASFVHGDNFSSNLVNETGISYSRRYSINLSSNDVNRVTGQATYSTATIANVSFKDGKPSTGTLTVSSPTALVASNAQNTITIVSTNGLAGAIITLNGKKYTEGYQWTRNSSSNTSAISLAAAINGSLYGISASTSAPGVVTIRVSPPGSYYNNYTLTTSTVAMTLGGANFSGGRDGAIFQVGTISMAYGVQWSTGSAATTTSSTTAKSISDAIAANSTLASQVVSTWTVAGVVSVTAAVSGSNYNFTLYSSSQSALNVSGTTTSLAGAVTGNMQGGVSSDIQTSLSRIHVANRLNTALPVLFNRVSGSGPGSLVNQTTYYAISIDSMTFKLSATSTGAVAGTAVSITTQALAGGSSFYFSPLPYTGNAGFAWQYSNDGTNWVNVSASSVTVGSNTVANSTFWDFGLINSQYLSVLVSSPATGALALSITLNGFEATGGDVFLASTQTFTGSNTFNNQVTVSSAVSISGNLSVASTATISSGLSVSGVSALSTGTVNGSFTVSVGTFSAVATVLSTTSVSSTAMFTLPTRTIGELRTMTPNSIGNFVVCTSSGDVYVATSTALGVGWKNTRTGASPF